MQKFGPAAAFELFAPAETEEPIDGRRVGEVPKHINTEDLSADITDFTLQGTPVQPEVDLLQDQGTFLVLANIEEEVASLLFFAPTPTGHERRTPMNPVS
mgnify:CR=1 FL=1